MMKKKKIILTILGCFILLLISVGICLSLYLNKNVKLQDKSTFLFTTQQLLIEKDHAKLIVDFDSPRQFDSQNKSKESVWINWTLEKDGKITSGRKESYLIFNTKRISPNGVHLNRQEGDQNFSMGEFEFSWSYGSTFFIWVYPYLSNVK
jgi:hypothetical protein